MAAALSFYSLFSIAPLILLILSLGSFFVDPVALEREVEAEIDHLIGSHGARAVGEMLRNWTRSSSGGIATTIGIIGLAFGASQVFGELQEAMNIIWNVKKRPSGWRGYLRARLGSFCLVVVLGLLVIVMLFFHAVLGFAVKSFPGANLILWSSTFIGMTIVIFLLYKILPDARVEWRSALTGAATTSLLFLLGTFLIGLYLSRSPLQSMFGTAGSLVALLVWLYYSGQILFFGAELTQVLACRKGRPIVPRRGAVSLDATTE